MVPIALRVADASHNMCASRDKVAAAYTQYFPLRRFEYAPPLTLCPQVTRNSDQGRSSIP